MIRITPKRLSMMAIALLGLGSLGLAKIKALTLEQMVAETDDAVVGEIVQKEVFSFDHPTDGPDLFFTNLTIEGSSLKNGSPSTVVITFAGGFTEDGRGVWNSEAPSAEDTKVGNRVVAFYKHTTNMGGDLEANSLYAAHGGLYRTIKSRRGVVVQGRGTDFAIPSNIALAELDERITMIDKAIQEAEKQ